MSLRYLLGGPREYAAAYVEDYDIPMIDCSISFSNKESPHGAWGKQCRIATECFLETIEKCGIRNIAKSTSEYNKFVEKIKKFGRNSIFPAKYNELRRGMFTCLWTLDVGNSVGMNFCALGDVLYHLDFDPEKFDSEKEVRDKMVADYEREFIKVIKKREKELCDK